LEHLAQERVGDRHQVGDVFCQQDRAIASAVHVGAGDSGGEQAVGDGLRVGVGEVRFAQVVDQGGLEGFVQAAQRAVFGFVGHQCGRRVADAARQERQPVGQRVGGADDVAQAVAEGARPLLAPGVGVVGIGGPAQLGLQGGGDVFQLERGVGAVPAQDAQRGQCARFLVEVGEGDLALAEGRSARIGGAEGGDKEQVFQSPDGLVGAARAAAGDEGVQDAAQDDDGQVFGLEFEVEDAPGLVIHQGADLFEGLDFGGVLGIEAQLSGVIIKDQVLGVVNFDGPVEFVAQVVHQGGEVRQAAEFLDVMIGHECSFFHHGDTEVFLWLSQCPPCLCGECPQQFLY